MSHIKIKDIAIYHPETVVENDHFIRHFESKGQNVTGLIRALGREKRYVAGQNETSLTMAIDVTHALLQKTGLLPTDLDLIVFTTQVPETTLPSNAIRLHDAIGAGPRTIVFDVNANCAGMVVALEQISQYMKASPTANRALIIGSDMWSLIHNENDPVSMIAFADGAAAMILEKTEEDVGFIDAIYHVDSGTTDKMSYPAEGFAKGIRETGDLKHMVTFPFDTSMVLDASYEMIDELLKRNNLEPNDAKYCFSQFTIKNIQGIQEHFDINDENMMFIADKYSYTGTSSPVFALHEGLEQGRIKRGDHVVFWTLGHGLQLVATLVKY